MAKREGWCAKQDGNCIGHVHLPLNMSNSIVREDWGGVLLFLVSFWGAPDCIIKESIPLLQLDGNKSIGKPGAARKTTCFIHLLLARPVIIISRTMKLRATCNGKISKCVLFVQFVVFHVPRVLVMCLSHVHSRFHSSNSLSRWSLSSLNLFPKFFPHRQHTRSRLM